MSEAPLWAELGETISAVRGQLQQAAHEGEGEGKLKFRTGPVELEFSVEVRKEGNAKTRISAASPTTRAPQPTSV
ncbi:hypothetical protein OG735_02215 [Streptomyces sp. NBC_01210]|uniref:trypco2 family protein n=1 Tax=Streptomyces sp. NBC_01210 TaxID=2903774 RepID=UPI002E10C3D4|nr:hypothetical protein OG735_02215 [Streptomyces sp. NBC_01210]